jgi:hypothetical protein
MQAHFMKLQRFSGALSFQIAAALVSDMKADNVRICVQYQQKQAGQEAQNTRSKAGQHSKKQGSAARPAAQVRLDMRLWLLLVPLPVVA